MLERFLPRYGRYRLTEFTKHHVQLYIAELLESVSRTTVNIELRHMKMMFGYAVMIMEVLARNKAGLDKKIHLHTLTHAFATWLLEHGALPQETEKLPGHSDIQTTMRYVHEFAEQMRTAVDRLPRIDVPENENPPEAIVHVRWAEGSGDPRNAFPGDRRCPVDPREQCAVHRRYEENTA